MKNKNERHVSDNPRNWKIRTPDPEPDWITDAHRSRLNITNSWLEMYETVFAETPIIKFILKKTFGETSYFSFIPTGPDNIKIHIESDRPWTYLCTLNTVRDFYPEKAGHWTQEVFDQLIRNGKYTDNEIVAAIDDQ